MLTKRDLFVKWSVYAVAVLALLFVHSLTLHRIHIWGVAPFLPPLIAATLSSMEDSRSAAIFGLVFGACCDLTIAAPFPCLYTIAFTAAALIASVMAQSVLQPGFFCSFVVSLVAFVIVDVLNMLPLLLGGRAGLVPMLSLAGREFAVSCAALLICHPVLSFVHRRFTL